MPTIGDLGRETLAVLDRVLHTARMRALLLVLATGDAPPVGGIGGLAMRALLDPAALGDDEVEMVAEAMVERQRGRWDRLAMGAVG